MAHAMRTQPDPAGQQQQEFQGFSLRELVRAQEKAFRLEPAAKNLRRRPASKPDGKAEGQSEKEMA